MTQDLTKITTAFGLLDAEIRWGRLSAAPNRVYSERSGNRCPFFTSLTRPWLTLKRAATSCCIYPFWSNFSISRAMPFVTFGLFLLGFPSPSSSSDIDKCLHKLRPAGVDESGFQCETGVEAASPTPYRSGSTVTVQLQLDRHHNYIQSVVKSSHQATFCWFDSRFVPPLKTQKIAGFPNPLKFSPGTCDWRDSLVSRPEGV